MNTCSNTSNVSTTEINRRLITAMGANPSQVYHWNCR